MEKSSCEFGRELEHYVVQKFQELGINASRTIGSGNKGQIGDVNNSHLIVECKNRNTENITINQKTWDKLVSEVPLHSKRLPLYILRNKNKKTWAVMDIDDFFTVLKGYLQNENNHC